MKKLIVAAAVGLVAVGALAQGQFTFGNKNTLLVPPLESKVFDKDGITPLAGANYFAQAYVKAVGAPDSSYAAVGAAVPFRTGANAGYIASTVVTTSFAGGTEIAVQMRAWEAAKGTSYEAALAAGGLVGSDPGFQGGPLKLTVAVAPATPPDMVGLASFSLVPEPSTLALGVLGAFALLLRRRN